MVTNDYQYPAGNHEQQNPGLALWIDTLREGDIHAFKIGFDFMCNPDEGEMKKLEQV